MNSSKPKKLLPIMLAVMSSVPAAFGQATHQPQTPPNSAASSLPSATPVISKKTALGGRQGVLNACSAAVDDLAATKELADALDAENDALRARLATEQRTTALLTELNETRRSENAALQTAVAAKNETIAAKDAVIAGQEKLIGELRSKRTSPWRRIGDILIGFAAAVVLK
mgnify:CR=1 FL=1